MIAIVAYNAGNSLSVKNAVERAGYSDCYLYWYSDMVRSDSKKGLLRKKAEELVLLRF